MGLGMFTERPSLTASFLLSGMPSNAARRSGPNGNNVPATANPQLGSPSRAARAARRGPLLSSAAHPRTKTARVTRGSCVRLSLLVDLRQMAAASSASSCLAGRRRCEQSPLLLLHLKHPFVRDLVVGRPLQLQIGRLQRRRSMGSAIAVRAVGVVRMKLQRIVGTWTGRPSEAPVPALENNGDRVLGESLCTLERWKRKACLLTRHGASRDVPVRS
jgi:hypothetical protein